MTDLVKLAADLPAAELALLKRLARGKKIPWLKTAEERSAAESLQDRHLVHVCRHPSGERLIISTLRGAPLVEALR